MGIEFAELFFKITFWQITVWFFWISCFSFYPIKIIWFISSGHKINYFACVPLNQSQIKTDLIFYSRLTYFYNLWLSPVRSNMSMIFFCTVFIPHKPVFFNLWSVTENATENTQWIRLRLNLLVAIWFMLFSLPFITVPIFSLTTCKHGTEISPPLFDIQGLLKFNTNSEFLFALLHNILGKQFSSTSSWCSFYSHGWLCL